MTKPRYQDIRAAEIPEIKKEGGARIRVITGTIDGVSGPVTGIAANPIYLDVFVPAHSSFIQPIHLGHTAFAYVFEGEGHFAGDEKADGATVSHQRLVVLGDGDSVKVVTGKTPVRFLLVSGKPLHEPIARYGPFVMNTEEEIEQTLRSEEHTSELQSRVDLVCRLLLEKKKKNTQFNILRQPGKVELSDLEKGRRAELVDSSEVHQQ